MAENAFRWLDDEVNFTKRAAAREMVAGLIGSRTGRMNPSDMIEKMIEAIPELTGKFPNLHPKRVEEAVKAHQLDMFERAILASGAAADQEARAASTGSHRARASATASGPAGNRSWPV